MIAIIGLGNPGDQYANTKHNAGFWVVDELVRRQKLSYKPGKGPFIFAQHSRREVLMIKPTTGMNLSGIAVKRCGESLGSFVIGYSCCSRRCRFTIGDYSHSTQRRRWVPSWNGKYHLSTEVRSVPEDSLGNRD